LLINALKAVTKAFIKII